MTIPAIETTLQTIDDHIEGLRRLRDWAMAHPGHPVRPPVSTPIWYTDAADELDAQRVLLDGAEPGTVTRHSDPGRRSRIERALSGGVRLVVVLPPEEPVGSVKVLNPVEVSA